MTEVDRDPGGSTPFRNGCDALPCWPMQLAVQYYRGGVFLPALDLWLDSHAPQGGSARVFVSHAHSDHLGNHREVIVSVPTARLFQARMPGQRTEHVLSWGEPKGFEAPGGGWEIVLWPAGHILGSAMAEVRVNGLPGGD